MQTMKRGPAWRLLDTAGGLAIGILLCIALYGWRSTAQPSVSAASSVSAWQAGPWPGCTLLDMSQADVTDGVATVSHQVTATWACAHPLPPALLTPVVPTPPKANR